MSSLFFHDFTIKDVTFARFILFVSRNSAVGIETYIYKLYMALCISGNIEREFIFIYLMYHSILNFVSDF